MGIFIFGFVWVVRFWTAMLPLSLRYEPPAVVCQTNHFWSNKSSNFFLFHPRPPPCSRHDKQPMVITRSLPVSEGDYFLPAENQMTNDHAEWPQQQCVNRKADEGGVERRGAREGWLVFTCPRWPFPTRVCDSQATSAWMRSRAPVPRRSNLTAARRAESGEERGWWVCAWAPDCGWGSPMSAMLFLGPISHWQHHVFFTYLFSW